jgi:thiamine kinase-like enzyme
MSDKFTFEQAIYILAKAVEVGQKRGVWTLAESATLNNAFIAIEKKIPNINQFQPKQSQSNINQFQPNQSQSNKTYNTFKKVEQNMSKLMMKTKLVKDDVKRLKEKIREQNKEQPKLPKNLHILGIDAPIGPEAFENLS